eukprot:NODE_3072_length_1036_cov_47.453245_g2928_i0.p1 GENE.NODE_3072_length_1036_cov_47.453245_g2928_i0~~NODE_3072_length_1036_cov_47.453245_g2928_i0.p1  ORF type:complete len:336 (-),score=153.95 NODE_3072_length_1036_cov_47.453245_g2928_i0:28-987(-)
MLFGKGKANLQDKMELYEVQLQSAQNEMKSLMAKEKASTHFAKTTNALAAIREKQIEELREYIAQLESGAGNSSELRELHQEVKQQQQKILEMEESERHFALRFHTLHVTLEARQAQVERLQAEVEDLKARPPVDPSLHDQIVELKEQLRQKESESQKNEVALMARMSATNASLLEEINQLKAGLRNATPSAQASSPLGEFIVEAAPGKKGECVYYTLCYEGRQGASLRFSVLTDFDDGLKTIIQDRYLKLPTLPPKQGFFTNEDAALINKRREGVQLYLNTLLRLFVENAEKKALAILFKFAEVDVEILHTTAIALKQ